MFLKYNTPIPFTAPVEGLFSYAGNGMVLTKKRSSMTDSSFKQQLLLKSNTCWISKVESWEIAVDFDFVYAVQIGFLAFSVFSS